MSPRLGFLLLIGPLQRDVVLDEKVFTAVLGKVIYLGACLIVGIRLARFGQIARTVPVENAVKESIDLAEMLFAEAQRHYKHLFSDYKE